MPVILGEIRGLFRTGGAVKVSRRLKELSLKINKIRQQLNNESGRSPTITELAEITGESVTQDVIDSIFSRFCVGK